MIEIEDFCITCGRTRKFRKFCEEDTMEYNGINVPFMNTGYICLTCGDTIVDPAQYDLQMQEIRETYNQMYRG